MSLEKLTKQIYEECIKEGEPVTIDEARDMAEMELNSKEISNYTQSAEIRSKTAKPKTVVVSDEKIELFSMIWEGIYNTFGENAQIIKQNKEISVKIADRSFKIDIIEHRKAK